MRVSRATEVFVRRIALFLISSLIVGASVSASAGTGFPAEQRTSRYLDSVRQEPLLLLAFLREIPKGGDLHNHLAGAIYAETLIDFAAKVGLCVDRQQLRRCVILRSTTK